MPVDEMAGFDPSTEAELRWRPRNRIPADDYSNFAYQETGYPELSLIKIEGDDERHIWDAAEIIGTRESVGVVAAGCVAIEPYTYATALLREGLGFIGRFADATEWSAARGFDQSLAHEAKTPDLFHPETLRRLRLVVPLDVPWVNSTT